MKPTTTEPLVHMHGPSEVQLAGHRKWDKFAIKKLRVDFCKCSQEEFAAKVQVTPMTIYRWEKGLHSPQPENISILEVIGKEFDFSIREYQAVKTLLEVLQNIDSYTEEHSWRVAGICEVLARRSGLDDQSITTLAQAAELHDIGKMGIPLNILNKPGLLTKEEFEKMKEHPTIGRFLVEKVMSDRVSSIVHQHHERLDGGGYPLGLKGDLILNEARILAVADVFDAMTTARNYRKKKQIPFSEAAEILRRDHGLDQEYVQMLIDVVHDGSLSERGLLHIVDQRNEDRRKQNRPIKVCRRIADRRQVNLLKIHELCLQHVMTQHIN